MEMKYMASGRREILNHQYEFLDKILNKLYIKIKWQIDPKLLLKKSSMPRPPISRRKYSFYNSRR
jgi:hypothetical protein